ncbi:nucleotidyltransferase family protein [Blastomonas aquatica]|uniref:nucleotidyltransferase family protein n=1 Tax=Blastomonas aquatica TaxID=1510276 RepID=UPI00166B7274|nr:nucleotidyltransferase family protein [Blastomonas aquatica]
MLELEGSSMPDGVKLADAAALVRLLKHSIDPSTNVDSIEGNWERRVHLAMRLRILGILTPSLSSIAERFSPNLRADCAEWNKLALLNNLSNVARSVHAWRTIESAGIKAILFKGPVRSFKVYGRWDARPSSDVDILVHPSEYNSARAALMDAGYSTVSVSDNTWWHKYLGESAFYGPGRSHPLVDLHNKVQQPGTPAPREIEQFFEQSSIVSIGDRTARTFSENHDLMLCIINFAKALRSGSPWIIYAHELMWCTKNSSTEDLKAIADLAAKNRIERLLSVTMTLSKQLFGHNDIHQTSEPERYKVIASAFGTVAPRLMRRTNLLWNWTDGSTTTRSYNFLRELLTAYRSEIAFRKNAK